MLLSLLNLSSGFPCDCTSTIKNLVLCSILNLVIPMYVCMYVAACDSIYFLYLYLQATDTLFDDIHWLIVHSLKAAQVHMYDVLKWFLLLVGSVGLPK